MKIINNILLDVTSNKAKLTERGRMNYDLHQSTSNPLNRLLNAMEPHTYIRPHRHSLPPKDESVIVLRGAIIAFVFDEQGNITAAELIDPKKGTFGMDIPAGEWHGLLVIEPNTVLYEAKEGPYCPIADCDWAVWAPQVHELDLIEQYKTTLYEKVKWLHK